MLFPGMQWESALKLSRRPVDNYCMKCSFQLVCLTLAGLCLTGCDSGVFDEGAAQGVIESGKVQLNSEVVLLTPAQVTCGEKKGLWIVDQLEGGGGAIGRLTDSGRALNFGDDVRMGDRRFTNPYVQLNGSFALKVKKVDNMTDDGVDAKIVEAKAGVVIDHECFDKPLPLLGIDRGDFSEDADPRFHLQQRNGWTMDQLLH